MKKSHMKRGKEQRVGRALSRTSTLGLSLFLCVVWCVCVCLSVCPSAERGYDPPIFMTFSYHNVATYWYWNTFIYTYIFPNLCRPVRSQIFVFFLFSLFACFFLRFFSLLADFAFFAFVPFDSLKQKLFTARTMKIPDCSNALVKAKT